MKIFYIGIFSMALLFTSCGESSTKGKWTAEDKKSFSDECLGVKEIQDLGESGKKLCDCMLKKSEAEFNSFTEADGDEAKMTTIGEACAGEMTVE